MSVTYDMLQFVLISQFQALGIARRKLLSALLVFVLVINGTDGMYDVFST